MKKTQLHATLECKKDRNNDFSFQMQEYNNNAYLLLLFTHFIMIEYIYIYKLLRIWFSSFILKMLN